MAEAGIPPSQTDHQAEGSSSPNDKSAPVTQSIFKNGQYINPWDTWEDNTLKKFLKWVLFDKSKINLPSASVRRLH